MSRRLASYSKCNNQDDRVPHRSAQWTDSFSGEQKRQMNVRRGCASNRSSGKFQLAVTVMSSFFKCLIAVCIFSVVAGMATEPPGFVEGHLKILSLREVELADGNAPAITAENYAEYPLIILSHDGKKEIARVTADGNGNYRTALPPGDYVLDVQRRARGHVRAKPQRFTVVSDQTVRVDMDIDTGVR
ncbi:MAG: hypothetical protein DME96_09305 [Verrucomicrobia bacterium]|nr:MAG: hypothetical protein DME96_09305 [Verrucomicrobiota bacterium]